MAAGRKATVPEIGWALRGSFQIMKSVHSIYTFSSRRLSQHFRFNFQFLLLQIALLPSSSALFLGPFRSAMSSGSPTAYLVWSILACLVSAWCTSPNRARFSCYGTMRSSFVSSYFIFGNMIDSNVSSGASLGDSLAHSNGLCRCVPRVNSEHVIRIFLTSSKRWQYTYIATLTLLVIFSVAYTFIKLKEGHSHFFFAQRTLLIFIIQALSSPQMGLVSPRYISNFPSSF